MLFKHPGSSEGIRAENEFSSSEKITEQTRSSQQRVAVDDSTNADGTSICACLVTFCASGINI